MTPAMQRPYLFEATRLISRSWTRRLSTGIDRVCYAYLDHFGSRAQAVVQHRGVVRILTPQHSDRLFAMLQAPDADFRSKMMAFGPRAMVSGRSLVDGAGAIYINVSHTDFDLPSHAQWTAQCGIRPTYLIHDLIPITHAQYCKDHAVKRHRGRVTNALLNAAGIILNSESTASELAAFAGQQGLKLPPVLAASLAGAKLPKPVAAQKGSAPYFVCLGTIEARKNHILLLQIWQRLIDEIGDRAPRLIIVGQWGVGADPVRAMLQDSAALRDHVTVITQCPDRELGPLIAGAQALLMPTLAEGFGLPLVEALELGTPVIASDLPCFREMGQGIPTLLDPLDADAWQRLIRTFGKHPERARQRALLPSFQPPSWRRHFADVEAWFAELPRLSQKTTMSQSSYRPREQRETLTPPGRPNLVSKDSRGAAPAGLR